MTDPDKLPDSLEIPLPGGVPLLLRRILPGSFRMGSRGEYGDEEPAHFVKIPQPFYLGIFPVTQEQYRAIAPLADLDPEPGDFKDRDDSARRPVENVSWDDAMALCAELSKAGFFRAALITAGLKPVDWQAGLPSEAMWEYACRAGTETEYWSGDGEAALVEVGWCDRNSGNESHPVGRLPANQWGLHDMHGNVWELCADAWDEEVYRTRVDGINAAEASNVARVADDDRSRVRRGGPWNDVYLACRSASRNSYMPDDDNWVYGFRFCVFPCSGYANQPPQAETGTELAAGATEPRDGAEEAQAAGESSFAKASPFAKATEDKTEDRAPAVDLSQQTFSPRSGDDTF